jgi:hypothetical protein
MSSAAAAILAAASVASFVGVSLITQKSNQPLPLVDNDGNPMAIKGWFGLAPDTTKEG